MNFIQDTKPFRTLKPYFLPAIYHRIIVGNRRMYQLSISLDGQEVIIKKSIKTFSHTSFNKVITGAVRRMEKLFSPDSLALEVILLCKPTITNLELSFELVNKNLIKIGNEEYIASIMVAYSYNKMDKVTYYPIIYRKVCSNGMVAVMSRRFVEVISVDKIFEIGCEWTRCNFETYQKRLANYFKTLQQEKLSKTKNNINSSLINQIEKVLRIDTTSQETKERDRIFGTEELNSENPRFRMEDILGSNIKDLGDNQFAVWNAITEFASTERNYVKRNEMFMNAGRYLSKELEKSTIDSSDNLFWDELESMAN